MPTGFDYAEKEISNSFAVDITGCPYVDACNKYGCFELARIFCESDDMCYGNLHPKLSLERIKTLGKGRDVCDFAMRIKEK